MSKKGQRDASKRRKIAGTVDEANNVKLTLMSVADHETGNPLTSDEVAALFHEFLAECGKEQQWMIEHNQALDVSAKGTFSSAWSVKNMELAPVPDDYIETFNTQKVNSVEAMRLLSSYQRRDEIAKTFEKIGWDASFEDVKKSLDKKWLDHNLYNNVKRSGKRPELPIISRPRFLYSKAATQTGELVVSDIGIYMIGLAVGPRRVDMFLPCDKAMKRYAAWKITRPTFYFNDNGVLTADVSFVENWENAKITERRSVLAVDLNTDGTRPFAAGRVFADGHASRPFGPSIESEKILRHREAVDEHLAYAREKQRSREVLGLVGSPKYERAAVMISQLEHKRACLTEALDYSLVEDVLAFVRPGEGIIIENLSWASGSKHFRFGSFYDKLLHACVRCGVKVVRVNPAGTSQDCPFCGSRKSLGDIKMTGDMGFGSPDVSSYRARKCSRCGSVRDRDDFSWVEIGRRGLVRLGFVGRDFRVSSGGMFRARYGVGVKGVPSPCRPVRFGVGRVSRVRFALERGDRRSVSHRRRLVVVRFGASAMPGAVCLRTREHLSKFAPEGSLRENILLSRIISTDAITHRKAIQESKDQTHS